MYNGKITYNQTPATHKNISKVDKNAVQRNRHRRIYTTVYDRIHSILRGKKE